MKIIRKKGISNLLITVLIGLFLASCSMTKDMKAIFKFQAPSLSSAERMEREVKRFATTVRPVPGNPDSHYRLARYYQEKGRHEDAIEDFKKVILIDPASVKAYNGIGVSCDLLGYSEEAVDYYKKGIEVEEVDYILNNLGYAYLRLGKPDTAVVAFKKALEFLEFNGSNKRLRNNLALAYARSGRYGQALGEFKKTGNEATAYYNIASLYYEDGLYPEAIMYLKRTLSVDPSFVKARSLLGSAVFRQEMHQPAEEGAPPEMDNPKTAQAEQLPGFQGMALMNEDGRQDIKIKVLIGKDISG